MKVRVSLFVSFTVVFFVLFSSGCSPFSSNYRDTGLKAFDFILSLQTPSGAIPEASDSAIVNRDSSMEYALIGLGAAYQLTGDSKYLAGLEKGIAWLAGVEEMNDPEWKGSWWFAYDIAGNHVVEPSGGGIEDVRGVDTTSALFVYLLYLDLQCDPGSGLFTRYAQNVRAALDFIGTKSLDADGLSYSSYLMMDGVWVRYPLKYAADQGDVWLGLEAAAHLYGTTAYHAASDKIRLQTEKLLYSDARGRYAVSMDSNGYCDWNLNDFGPIQAQGFLPWLWGNSENDANIGAVEWLSSKVMPNGSVSTFVGDPLYALSVAMLGIGASGVGKEAPLDSFDWLLNTLYDSSDGGFADSSVAAVEYVNVASFCAMALTRWKPSFVKLGHIPAGH